MANTKGNIGSKHHASKMTTAKVKQARKSFSTGKWSQRKLAKKYGISPQSMADILKRRSWKHVA